MEHSIALVTGTTSGLGFAAARTLAGEGWREIIVTGRSLARIQKTVAQLAAETKKTGLHAAGAGAGHAVQRSVRARRAGQARSADRFPTAQCRDGPR
ncbi:MAG: SDR family NAD(P)-dependent oxidoreductase [Chthoniobacter sp.]